MTAQSDVPMTSIMLDRVAPWFRSSGENPDTEPISYRAWKYLWQQLPSPKSGNLFNRIERTDWDLLVILDACRFDTLRAVSDCCVVGKAISPASSTPEFLRQASERGVFDDTTYVSANPQVKNHPPTIDSNIVDVSETRWETGLGTVPLVDILGESEERLRKGNRVVAHTLQPHYPHVCELDGRTRPVPNGLHPTQRDVLTPNTQFQAVLANGLIDLGEARDSYRIAAEHAWHRASETAMDLSKDGYTVIITADHGELFGEWGFVEHPVGVRIQELVSVPWVQFNPDMYLRDQDAKHSADERLEALGYKV